MSDREKTFREVIETLTAEHADWIDTDTGKQLHKRDGLLQQLREAVFGGMGGNGGSQFGSKLPMDAAAHDLLEEITVQATEALASVSHRPTPYGHAEDYVSSWASQTDENKIVTVSVKRTAEYDPYNPARPLVYRQLIESTGKALAESWVHRIEEYYAPIKALPIVAPCPSCGERYVYRQVDGHTVQADALNFLRDKMSGEINRAECSACAAYWPPTKFRWLAAAVGAEPSDELKGLLLDTP